MDKRYSKLFPHDYVMASKSPVNVPGAGRMVAVAKRPADEPKVVRGVAKETPATKPEEKPSAPAEEPVIKAVPVEEPTVKAAVQAPAQDEPKSEEPKKKKSSKKKA